MANKFIKCKTTTRNKRVAANSSCCPTQRSAADIFKGGQHRQLMKRAVEAQVVEQAIALQGTGGPPAFYYKRLKAGRRCSCLHSTGVPQGTCLACFGQEVVGGYEKYGTSAHTLDATFPNVVSVNCMIDWENGGAPARWKLVDGAGHGYIEFDVTLRTNLGSLDTLLVRKDTRQGGTLTYEIQAPGETAWTQLTSDTLTARLGNLSVKIRVHLVGSAYFKMLYLRYWQLNPPTDNQLNPMSTEGVGCSTALSAALNTDVPNLSRSHGLGPKGVFNQNGSLSMVLDGTLKDVSNDDFFVFLAGTLKESRWGVLGATAHEPLGVVVNWSVDIYQFQDHSIEQQFPL